MKKVILALALIISLASINFSQTKDTLTGYYNAEALLEDLQQIGLNEQQIGEIFLILSTSPWMNDMLALRSDLDTLAEYTVWLASQIGSITPIYPYAPYNLDTTEVNLTSVAIAWDDSTTSPDSFRVDYCLTLGGTWTLWDYSSDEAETITGLSDSTGYSFRVYTIKDGLTSNISNVLTVTTDVAAPPPPAGGQEGAQYFVGLTSSGDGSGSSWDNKRIYTSIVWANVPDTVYFDGGAVGDSVVYPAGITITQGNSGIVLTKGISDEHSGKVIFDANWGDDHGIAIDGNGASTTDITISRMTFRDFTWSAIYGDGENSGGLRNILIDSIRVETHRRAGIFFEGNNNVANNSDIVISNCYINDDNNGSSQYDNIYAQYMVDIRITGCILIGDNPTTSTSDLHCDNVQTYWVNNILVDNNFMYQSSATKVLGTQTLFTAEAVSGSTHVYYNNVLYCNLPNKNDWSIRTKVNDGKVVYIIHNTLIGYGRIQGADCSGYLYNNLFYGMYSPGSYGNAFSSIGSPAVRANNLVYDKDGVYTAMSGSTEGNPLFTSTTYSTSWDGEIGVGSPAINLGGNYQSIIEGFGLEWKDINGVERDSSPDAGAVQYVP